MVVLRVGGAALLIPVALVLRSLVRCSRTSLSSATASLTSVEPRVAVFSPWPCWSKSLTSLTGSSLLCMRVDLLLRGFWWDASGKCGGVFVVEKLLAAKRSREPSWNVLALPCEVFLWSAMQALIIPSEGEPWVKPV